MNTAPHLTDVHRAILADIVAARRLVFDPPQAPYLRDLGVAGLITTELVNGRGNGIAVVARPTVQGRTTGEYITVTVVLRRRETDPDEPLARIREHPEDVMWCGTEDGVTPAATDGGALPDEWPDRDPAAAGVGPDPRESVVFAVGAPDDPAATWAAGEDPDDVAAVLAAAVTVARKRAAFLGERPGDTVAWAPVVVLCDEDRLAAGQRVEVDGVALTFAEVAAELREAGARVGVQLMGERPQDDPGDGGHPTR